MTKLILAVGILISSFASKDARADPNCYLTVSTNEVQLGDYYYYGLYIATPPPQPPGPGWIAPPPTFFVTFHGTKNGIPDIDPGGETLQGTLPAGDYWLTGYQNPTSGVASGTYSRYADIVYNNNNSTLYCRTNTVWITLD